MGGVYGITKPAGAQPLPIHKRIYENNKKEMILMLSSFNQLRVGMSVSQTRTYAGVVEFKLTAPHG